MMKVLKKKMFPNLLAVILMLAAGSWGCAAKNHNWQNTSAFGKMPSPKELHLQKESASRGLSAPKELPEMTYEEYEGLGDVSFSRGDLGRAFMYYEKSLKLNPDNNSIHYKKGLLLVIGKMNEEAIREFQGVLKKESEHALSYEGMGLAFFQMAKYDDAGECFRKAVELDPKLWKAHNYLGIIYDYKREYKMAVREYAAAIARKDDNGLLYNNLGTSYFMAGECEKAISAFNKALVAKTEHGKIYNNLGFVLSNTGRYQEALEAFRKGGGEAQAYNNLGCIYLKQGEYVKAIRCFEKAIELKPTFYTKASENLRKARMARELSFDSNVQTSVDDRILRKKPNFKKNPDKDRAGLVAANKARETALASSQDTKDIVSRGVRVEASGAGQPVSLESLSVKKLKIWREPESGSVKFQFRLTNAEPHGRRIKGYTFVVLKPEKGSQEPLRCCPSTPLKHGRPTLFERGVFFSIARYRLVRGTFPDIEKIQHFKTATVYVYSKTGSLLFEKAYLVDNIFLAGVVRETSFGQGA
jgi:tetratricopeptide (TPR) repeat protein